MRSAVALTLAGVVYVWLAAPAAEPARPAEDFSRIVAPFLKSHCLHCHGGDKPKGGLSLAGLKGDLSKAADVETWRSVLEQIKSGEMPPRKEPRPSAQDVNQVTAVIADRLQQALAANGPQLPKLGNLVDHDLLFGTPAREAAASPGRVWRMRPEIYEKFLQGFGVDPRRSTQPFGVIPDVGFKDYAGLYTIDEPTTELLLRNAEMIVDKQTAAKGAQKEFVPLLDAKNRPSASQVETAFRVQFKLATAREPSTEELQRLVALYEKNLKTGDAAAAARGTLMAILLLPEAMYRLETGAGPEVPGGKRLLSPREIAFAVSFALGDRRDRGLFEAVDKGGLTTKEQVAEQVRRILADPKSDKARILQFFREYFGYHLALEVFKDRPHDIPHEPRVLVADTDRLILYILAKDQNVLAELLTTRKAFVNYALDTKKGIAKPASLVNRPRPNTGPPGEVHHAYGLPLDWKWTPEQPVELEHRAGILMQPSWLVAHSGNFDNDPIRRGRWIRERLLGGHVPDVPIGVDARVPDEPHRTLRQRLDVVHDAQCWRCHKLMNPLGLPFEQFDHYGRFRATETIVDLSVPARPNPKKGEPPIPVTKEVKVDTSGAIDFSGDPKLDGAVNDPIELMQKLAASERVRQVFVRHAFRYFLGRNETLGDARTLQDADQAYVQSGGSFQALVVALLTSDAFLYRR